MKPEIPAVVKHWRRRRFDYRRTNSYNRRVPLISTEGEGHESWGAWIRRCGEGLGRRLSEARSRRNDGHARAGQTGRLGGAESEGPRRRLRRGGGIRRTGRSGGQGRGGGGRVARRRRVEPGGKDRHRCDESNCGRAACKRRVEIFHRSRRIAYGAIAARI